jgi:hypothetical protein
MKIITHISQFLLGLMFLPEEALRVSEHSIFGLVWENVGAEVSKTDLPTRQNLSPQI